MVPDIQNLKTFLDEKVLQFNVKGFIEDDPISIPHRFTSKQDIEIMGFWSAVLAWGQRKTIINKCKELIRLMDGSPYDFITNHEESDLKPFLSFKHRTFNDVDTLYFLSFFKSYYQSNDSLESAFLHNGNESMYDMLSGFHDYFCAGPNFPNRTRKHIATPKRNSACKRINMFLRWMIRDDDAGVDFGIWKQISPTVLITPCDVHVIRVAKKLGLLHSDKSDWKTAELLTNKLREFDPQDPVKYDFALFGLGVEGYL